MFDPFIWSWPQWTLFVILVLGLLINVTQHGKPREGNYNGLVSIVSFALSMFLLTFGGFFGQ